MAASALLDRLESLGVTVTVVGEKLQLRPGSRVPPDLVEDLRQHKAEIMAYLTAPRIVEATPQWPAEEIKRRGERQSLLAWASELAEQDLVLAAPVGFIEAPLRPVTTERVSWYAARYLRTITSARIGQETGGWGMFTPDWHRQREAEAVEALTALRNAVAAKQDVGGG